MNINDLFKYEVGQICWFVSYKNSKDRKNNIGVTRGKIEKRYYDELSNNFYNILYLINNEKVFETNVFLNKEEAIERANYLKELFKSL